MAVAHKRWQDQLKLGPLSQLYMWLRWAKRKWTREPIVEPLASETVPLSTDELIALASIMPDYSRRLYGLGLSYFESSSARDLRRAICCLRSADSLGFEAPERTALYRGTAFALLGDYCSARRETAALALEEMTAKEADLRDRIAAEELHREIVSDAPQSAAWQLCEQQIGELPAVDTLLVLGDSDGFTASWRPEARYMQCAPDVNGLSPACLRGMRQFDTACGALEDLAAARAAGIAWQTQIVVGDER